MSSIKSFSNFFVLGRLPQVIDKRILKYLNLQFLNTQSYDPRGLNSGTSLSHTHTHTHSHTNTELGCCLFVVAAIFWRRIFYCCLLFPVLFWFDWAIFFLLYNILWFYNSYICSYCIQDISQQRWFFRYCTTLVCSVSCQGHSITITKCFEQFIWIMSKIIKMLNYSLVAKSL